MKQLTIYTNTDNSKLLTNYKEVDIYLPEVEDGLPLSPQEEMDKMTDLLKDLLGKDIKVTTTSEIVILWLLKYVPENYDIKVEYVCADEEGIYTHTLRTELDEDERDFLDPWPGGFFNHRIDLLF